MHQQTVYFRAPDAKFLLPWERIHPSQILPRSSPRRSAHPDFRIPRKISSLIRACIHMPSDYLLCQTMDPTMDPTLLSVEQSSNIASIRSTSKPSFFPRSRFEPLKIRAESFELMSVVQRLTRNCNKRQKKSHNSQEFIKDNRLSYS